MFYSVFIAWKKCLHSKYSCVLHGLHSFSPFVCFDSVSFSLMQQYIILYSSHKEQIPFKESNRPWNHFMFMTSVTWLWFLEWIFMTSVTWLWFQPMRMLASPVTWIWFLEWILMTSVMWLYSQPMRIADTISDMTMRGRDSSVVRAPNSWLKGRGFESPQERRENFLLQGRLSVLTLISVSVPPPCYRSST